MPRNHLCSLAGFCGNAKRSRAESRTPRLFLLRVRGAEKPGRNWRRHFYEKTFRACEEGFLRERVVSSALSGKTLVAGVNYLKKYM